MTSEETLGKALSLEGPLKKKSPNPLIGYQKRYFAVRDDGKLLAYYRKKPVSSTQSEAEDPLGLISIDSVTSITSIDDTQ